MTIREELQHHARTLNLLAVVADDCEQGDLFKGRNAAQEYFKEKLKAVINRLNFLSMKAAWPGDKEKS